jgi:hypothetical protein
VRKQDTVEREEREGGGGEREKEFEGERAASVVLLPKFRPLI